MKLFTYAFSVLFFVSFVLANLDPSITATRPSDSEVVNNPVVFRWHYFDPEGDTLDYLIVQIDEDRTFFSPMNYQIRGDDFQILLETGGEYYWRLQAVNRFGSALSNSNRFFLDTKQKVCSDGTKWYACSLIRPLYCDGGSLRENCQRCGCSEDGSCQSEGNCLIKRCSDGTPYGSCADTKPLYCFQGVIKEVCNLCGCSEGLVCLGDGSCVIQPEEKPTLVEPVIDSPKQGLSWFERIANFFRYIFTGKALYK